jgi:hypothetical protein
MATPGAGIAVEGRDADEGGELSAAEAAEFGQFGDQGSRGHRADAGNGSEQVFPFAPGGRGANIGVDVGVDAGEFLFEEGEVAIGLEGPKQRRVSRRFTLSNRNLHIGKVGPTDLPFPQRGRLGCGDEADLPRTPRSRSGADFQFDTHTAASPLTDRLRRCFLDRQTR